MCANLLDTFAVLGGYWDPTRESPPQHTCRETTSLQSYVIHL